jgi:serine/threonine-protein kinase
MARGGSVVATFLAAWRSIRALAIPADEDDAAFRRAFEDEARSSNARVIRWTVCVIVPLHVLAAFVFHRRVETDPARIAWLGGLVRLQTVQAVVLASMGVVAWRGRPAALWRILGDVVGVWGLINTAATSANAQRAHPNFNVFIAGAFTIAFFLRMRPSLFASALLAGAAMVLGAIVLSPRDAAARSADGLSLLGVSSIAFFGYFLARSMRAKELRARLEFERLNDELERRVQTQVGEIVGHAKQIEALNSQLNQKVRERSRELSAALARLAEGHRVLEPGTVLGGRVELEARIGQGAMGIVYRGRDRVTGGPVAVKVVHAGSASELDGLHRFLREAEAVASVTHPAIVRSLHVDVSEDGRLFQVMELLEGETLEARLARAGALPPPVACRLGAVLAGALAAAHAAGVVHRDVKPSNVMLVRGAPGLKLLDFGIAKLREAGAESRRTGTRILGTPEFASPEQVNAPGAVAAPADVYALGLILYLCLSGRMPFEATTIRDWLIMHLAQPPAELAKHLPDLDPSLAERVMACLQKDPAARPSAAAMAALLDGLADRAAVPPLEALDLVRRASAAPGPGVSTQVTKTLTPEEAAFRSSPTLSNTEDVED